MVLFPTVARCLLLRVVMSLGMTWAWGASGAARLPVDYSIKRWVSSEQLPFSNVEALVQTRDGFIWFAMNGGLGRFDGQALEVYNARNTPELPVPVITSLLEDRDGSLWVGSAGGGLVRRRDGRFQHFGAAQGLANEQVKALCLGSDNRLWIGTDGGGVFSREPDGRFRRYNSDDGLRDPFIANLKVDPAGQLVVATFHAGLFVLRDGRFEPLALEPAPTGARSMALTQSGSGRIWLGTDDGIYVFEGDRFQRWREADQIEGVRPLMAWEAVPGEVWLGTDRGLVRWQGGDWSEYATGGSATPRMPGGFLVDHEGSIWLTTEGAGLVQLRATPVVALGAAEGLAGDEVTSVLVTREQALWVGTTDGLTRIGPVGRRRFGRADGLPDDFVYSVQEDAAGGIWVSTRRGGVSRWDGTSFKPVAGLDGATVQAAWCLAPGRAGSMWVGSAKGLFEWRNGQVVRRLDGKTGLSNDDVRCVADSGTGDVWVGTSYGLNRVTATGVESYAVTENKEAIEVVVALHPDADGALWVGTMARGLFRFQEGRFARFSTDDGLPDNGISSLLEDGDGRLWIGTGGGLAVVARQELTARALRRELPLNLRVFRRADGLRSEEFTATLQPTAARAADGRMWFASGNGLVSAAPNPVTARRRPPLVSLERVAVEGPSAVAQLTGLLADLRAMPLRPATELGYTPAPAGQRRAVFAPHGFELLHIPPRPERLDFQFVSPSFVAPFSVAYRYRLAGFDREWVEAGSRRAAYYTRVPPGKYRFEVEARTDGGVWSQPAAALNLIVEPAWWERLPVRVVGVVGFLGAGVGYFQVRVRKLRRQREQSAEFSRQLIRSQEQERARIAGELHDGLGQELQLIRNRAEIALRQAPPEADVACQLSSISETAARAIDGVRALSRGLRPPELDQLGLTQALRWLGKNQAESIEQKLDFRVEELDGALAPEQEVDFYRVAQEALNNAVKHSGASEITFEALWSEAGLQLSVFDNGQGFNREETEANPRCGSGLRSMQARTALLRGTLELHSEPGVGTRLTLLVPVPDKRRATP